MIELGIILKGASLGLSVAKYTGVIQDHLNLKVEQLAGSELEAGLRALDQAAHSEREQQFLLREARNRFIKAISLEEGFRLAAAHLGLALCHANLGDVVNAEHAVRGLAAVEPPRPAALLVTGRAVNRAAAKAPWWAVGAAGLVFPPLGAQLVVAKLAAPIAETQLAQHEEAVAGLVALQQEATQLLDDSLREGCDGVFGLAGRLV